MSMSLSNICINRTQMNVLRCYFLFKMYTLFSRSVIPSLYQFDLYHEQVGMRCVIHSIWHFKKHSGHPIHAMHKSFQVTSKRGR